MRNRKIRTGFKRGPLTSDHAEMQEMLGEWRPSIGSLRLHWYSTLSQNRFIRLRPCYIQGVINREMSGVGTLHWFLRVYWYSTLSINPLTLRTLYSHALGDQCQRDYIEFCSACNIGVPLRDFSVICDTIINKKNSKEILKSRR